MMYVEVNYDGCVFIGPDCISVIRQMKFLDIEEPENILAFKTNVQTRLLILGELILFYDSRSFLEACLESEIINSLIIDENYSPVETFPKL